MNINNENEHNNKPNHSTPSDGDLTVININIYCDLYRDLTVIWGFDFIRVLLMQMNIIIVILTVILLVHIIRVVLMIIMITKIITTILMLVVQLLLVVIILVVIISIVIISIIIILITIISSFSPCQNVLTGAEYWAFCLSAYTMLCYAMLYYNVLYYTILYYNILCYDMLCYTIQDHTIHLCIQYNIILCNHNHTLYDTIRY